MKANASIKSVAIALAALVGLVAVVAIVVKPRNTNGVDADRADKIVLSGAPATRETIPKISPEQQVHVHEIDVKFSDGDLTTIRWHRQMHADVPLPPYGAHYDALKALALSGDKLAAFSLFEILTNCEMAFSSRVEMEEALDILQQTHSIQLPSWEAAQRLADPEQIDEFEFDIRSRYKGCEGITVEQKLKKVEWLTLSANLGYSTAMILQAEFEEDTEAMVGAYRKAWEAGDADALFGLSHELQKSFNSGAEPRNKVEAYAALYAYTALLESGLAQHGEVAARQVQRIKDTLAGATEQMHEYEIEEAVRIAKDLIRSNPNCCFAM